MKNLNFGQAIAALKKGKRVSRAGWNGKGLWIFMQVPASIGAETIPKMQSLPEAVKGEFAKRGGGITYSNQIALCNPTSQISGWAPSTSDALAEDWMVLPDGDEGMAPERPPHQQRVIDEKAELDERREKLGVFIKENPIFQDLPAEERERLVRQESCMAEYSAILGERIAAFPA
jgi:hypothetical protein